MSTEKSVTVSVPLTEAKAIESFVARGDWSQLGPMDRARAYTQVCAQHGLNPMSQPFAFLRLNGKEVLYATRGATDQLAAIHRVTREIIDGPKIVGISGTKVAYCVARASHPNGRFETATATLPVQDPVNLYMKLETKAKRRATIALLGLAMLDETELATIPDRSQGDAPQPMRADIEQAVAEAELAARGAPIHLADLGIEARQLPETLPAPAETRPPSMHDLCESIRQCSQLGEVADRWVGSAEERKAWSAAERESCWTEAVMRVMAVMNCNRDVAAKRLKAAVEARRPKGDGPKGGGTPKPTAPATTDATGTGQDTAPAQGAQALALVPEWTESFDRMEHHIAGMSCSRHIENASRKYRTGLPATARELLAARLQRLSWDPHDGEITIESARELVARWITAGPVERVRPAARAKLAAGAR